jgi:hypothetical protein
MLRSDRMRAVQHLVLKPDLSVTAGNVRH